MTPLLIEPTQGALVDQCSSASRGPRRPACSHSL